MIGVVVSALGYLFESFMVALMGKAVDHAVQQFGEQHGVEEDLKKLTDSLANSLANAKLKINPIENLWLKNKGLQLRLKELLIRLKDAAYDADDLFDEFKYRILKQQIEQQGEEAGNRASSSSYSTPPPNKKIKTSFSSYTSGLFGKGDDHDDDVQRIREIKERLDGISADLEKTCNLLGLDAKDDTGNKLLVSAASRQRGPFSTEPKLFGRDKEMEKLKDLLLKPEVASESGHSGVSVLSIVGIGGIGKTTLAQEIFNDKSVEEFFKLRIWVCVSENFCTVSLTRKIIEYATKKNCDLTDFAALQDVLKEKITSERFLLVLDDVWNENWDKWKSLCAPLRYGKHGSKILVTTRSKKIADMVSDVDVIHLEGLDEESFWEFFKKCAFGSSNSSGVHHPRMEAMAKKMTCKLKGLPLAANTLGGLLSSNFREQYWESILDSKIWRLPQKEDGVMPVLQLSYQQLPLHLKQCFAFCSLYPKDHRFSESKLTRIWIAEGFILPQESIRIEELASSYFHELVARSFFQKSGNEKFIMHDLIHDLAELISEGESYRIEKGKSHEIPSMIRHLSVHKMEEGMQTNRLTAHYNKLRTYINRSIRGHHGVLKNLKEIRVLDLKYCKEMPNSIGKLIHLRYLDLSRCSNIQRLLESLCDLYNLQTLILQRCYLEELPNRIGKLIHLHYLDLSNNPDIRRLPESLGDLYNLQTLILIDCYNLKSLPDGMMKLINLRDLVITIRDGIIFIPEIKEVGKLTSLQNLSAFKVLKDDGHKLAELNCLKQLRGLLRITNLENVENEDEANTASLKSKEHLDELELQWTSEVNSHISEQVLEGLQPHHNLRSLTISGYNGARPPNWLHEQVYSRLEYLKLKNCKRWNDVIVVGQLSQLKSLYLVRIPVQTHDFQKLFDPKVCRFFSQLEGLVLEGITMLEDLPNLGQLPCLKSLDIRSLPGVKMIGDRFFATTEEGSCFPTLHTLRFNEMTAWEVFNCSNDRNIFPCLEVLEISNCQILQKLPRLSPSITDLKLKNVGLLDCPRFWKVIDEGSSVTNSASVTDLSIQECPNLKSLELTSLVSLWITECPKLIDFQLPPSITKLCLSDCGNLSKSLPGCLHNLTSLRELTISNCPNLVSLPLEPLLVLRNLNIENCNELRSVEGIRSLRNLKITGCHKLLLSLGDAQTEKFSLPMLEIDDTALIKNLVADVIALTISFSCEAEMFEGEDQKLLQSLTSLRYLRFSDCKNLRSLPTKLYALTSLCFLVINNCPQIQSLPENGLPPALTYLAYHDCHRALEQQLEIHLAEIKKSGRYSDYF